MAFVYRSQKSSPFESNSIKQSLHQQLPISETNYQVRIHERDPTLKKLITNKKCSKPQKRKAEQPSIPNKQKVFDSLPPNVKKNQRYNFRFLKKSRVESFGKKNIDENFLLKHKKQFYDLPGSLSHKSLVKYSNKVHSLNENKTPCQSPGPGSYNPQLVTSAQSPIFRDTTNFDVSLLKNKDSQSVEQKPEQNLFAVKYNYMNSRAFKKSLNLRKISNRILMSKLFSSQKNLHEKENNIPDQFTQVDEFRPGPGAYTEPTKSKNAPSFGNLERFKDKSPTSGSNKFYDVSVQNKDINQTSCFCSEVKRFDEDRVITQPLQYTNYDNSLIRDSHNKKDSGFKLDLGRIEEKVVDQRPYYQLSQVEKMEFMTKFYKYEAKRQLFHNKSQTSPGPEDYDTSLSWRKQHSCIINKDVKKYKACSQGSEPRQVNFYMCSHQNLHKKKQKGPKGVLKSSKLSQSPSPIKQQPSPQKYYETSPSWQIKTFNQRYINDILPANNPIKNKIL